MLNNDLRKNFKKMFINIYVEQYDLRRNFKKLKQEKKKRLLLEKLFRMKELNSKCLLTKLKFDLNLLDDTIFKDSL